MKILLISPLPPPEGGIAIWTQKYKAYCAAHGHELTIVNTALIGSRGQQINSKRNYFNEVKRTVNVLCDLRKQLKRKKFDIAHLNTSCSKFGIYRDLLCAKRIAASGVPFVVHCRCNIEDQLNGVKGAISAFQKMVSLADKVFTLNRASFAYANRIVPGKAVTVPNFVEESAICDSYSVREKVQNVVFVGHVQKTKGAEEILRAAQSLLDIRFQLVGPVHEAIKNLPHSENVEFLGKKSPDEVRPYLEQADIFLFPSYTEGFSNALAEAMAAGLPVITTDVGANAEMLEGQGGVIVPVGNSDAIVAAVHKMQSQDVRKKMSVWNIDKVKSTYLISSVMEKLLTIYQDINK